MRLFTGNGRNLSAAKSGTEPGGRKRPLKKNRQRHEGSAGAHADDENTKAHHASQILRLGDGNGVGAAGFVHDVSQLSSYGLPVPAALACHPSQDFDGNEAGLLTRVKKN